MIATIEQTSREKFNMSEEAGGRIGDLIAACIKKYNWSQAKTDAAIGWATAMMVEPYVRSRAARESIDFAAVERVAAKLPEADRVAFMSDKGLAKGATIDRTLAVAAEEGVPLMIHEIDRAKSFGAILGVLLMRDRYTEQFAGL